MTIPQKKHIKYCEHVSSIIDKGIKMNISVKNALKAPLEKGILIMALVPAVLNLLILNIIEPESALIQGLIHLYISLGLSEPDTLDVITCLFYGAAVLSWVIVSGYTTLFAHHTLNQETSLFPKVSFRIISVGLRTILFGLFYTLLLTVLAIPTFFILSLCPLILSAFLAVILIVFALVYLFAAATCFIKTFEISAALRLITNGRIIAGHWKQLLKMLGQMLLIGLILLIPLLAVKLAVVSLSLVIPFILFIAVYVISLLEIYPSLVNIHLLGQYAALIQEQDTRSAQPAQANILPAEKADKEPATPSKKQPVKSKTKSVKSSLK